MCSGTMKRVHGGHSTWRGIETSVMRIPVFVQAGEMSSNQTAITLLFYHGWLLACGLLGCRAPLVVQAHIVKSRLVYGRSHGKIVSSECSVLSAQSPPIGPIWTGPRGVSSKFQRHVRRTRWGIWRLFLGGPACFRFDP